MASKASRALGNSGVTTPSPTAAALAALGAGQAVARFSLTAWAQPRRMRFGFVSSGAGPAFLFICLRVLSAHAIQNTSGGLLHLKTRNGPEPVPLRPFPGRPPATSLIENSPRTRPRRPQTRGIRSQLFGAQLLFLKTQGCEAVSSQIPGH